MKINKIFNIGLFLLIGALITINDGFAQNLKNEDSTKANISALIRSKEYIFVAQSVLPLSGRTINLTSAYNLKVFGDTLVSDLPYFGRAYVAPLNPDEVGIHFTSTNFSYNVKERKKGGWEISIVPKDETDVRQMFLTVFKNGQASLQVTNTNRQGIAYNGYITTRESK